jgi:hypothetical protein
MHERAMKAEKAIEDHNAECIRLCDNRKRCGYEKYRPYMSCSDCPKDWIIDLSNAAQHEGGEHGS